MVTEGTEGKLLSWRRLSGRNLKRTEWLDGKLHVVIALHMLLGRPALKARFPDGRCLRSPSLLL